MQDELTPDFLLGFWSKVDFSGPCWNWKAATRKAYGAVRARKVRKMMRANRVAYAIANGSIPRGLVVMHTCDNPSCVKPQHLVAATQRQNMQDSLRKGRLDLVALRQRGFQPTVPDETIRRIRRERAVGARPVDLGRKYGLSPSYVSTLTLGKKRTEIR